VNKPSLLQGVLSSKIRFAWEMSLVIAAEVKSQNGFGALFVL